MRPWFQIQFLFHRRFPRYTDAVDERVNRIVRETSDPDLLDDGTLQRIADELDLDFEELRPAGELEATQTDSAGGERDASGRLSARGRERLRAYLDEARDHRDTLYDMPDDEFWGLYCAECREELAERETQGLEKDRHQFFNEPKADVNFEHWLVMLRWTPEEAVALPLEKEPGVVNSESLRPHQPPSPFREEYARRLELVHRAIKAGRFREDIDPPLFLEWAREIGLTYPAELESLREAKGATPTGQEESSGATKRRSSETKVDNNLLRILIAVASQRYEFDPFDDPAPKIDKKMLNQLNADFKAARLPPVGDKTLWKRLTDAVKQARDDSPQELVAAKSPHARTPPGS